MHATLADDLDGRVDQGGGQVTVVVTAALGWSGMADRLGLAWPGCRAEPAVGTHAGQLLRDVPTAARCAAGSWEAAVDSTRTG